jgi:hypothetical protein
VPTIQVGPGPSWPGGTRAPQFTALLLIACGGWRAWDTWPAVDRHNDRRGERLVAAVTLGADESHAVIASDMDWQSENALLYSSRWEHTNVAWLRMAEVLPHLPFFVDDNAAIDRDVILTGDAAADVSAAYGSIFDLEPLDPPDVGSLATAVARIPRGAPYVLTRLKPTSDVTFDESDYRHAVASLTDRRVTTPSGSLYEVLAGTAGDTPVLHRSSDRPFRTAAAVAGDRFDVRMESWLPEDTFRRAGFGQVIRGRQQVLIVERGVSLVWFAASGEPQVAYAAGLYAPRPRYRIARATLHLASDAFSPRPRPHPGRCFGRRSDPHCSNGWAAWR